ncbi:MAG: septum site-determining protein MinC [Janthinobacterium lividum]
MVTSAPRPRSFLRLRGKSFMSVVLTPDLPLVDWVAQLDEQVARSPKVFEGRPVLLDVSLLAGLEPEIPGLVQGLAERGIRVIGIDGSVPHTLGGMASELPPVMAGGRNAALLGENEPQGTPARAPAAAEPARPIEPSALVVDQPIRSGQSLTHTAGDVTIIGSVASGSEVIAGGSIHVYGTLRGRAIAGLLGPGPGGARPRIFCSKLQAELLAIDGVYKTADELDPKLQGRAVQAWLEGDELRVAPLD